MRSQTKLWLLIVTSAFISTLLFASLSLLTGHLGDKGYSLKQLNHVANLILENVTSDQAFHADQIKPILDAAGNNHPEVHFEWVAANGSTIYDTLGLHNTYTFDQLADRIEFMPDNLWGYDEPVSLIFSANQGDQRYYLLMGLSSGAMKQGQIYFYIRTFQAILMFMVPLIIAFLIPYLLSLAFFYKVNKRIKKLNQAIRQLDLHGEITVLDNYKKDEIGELTAHYNVMALRIQNQAEQIKQFDTRRSILLSNLSHDLRTPLTMILGYAEMIRNGSYRNEQELQAGARILLQRSRYMNKLLDQLLDITKQDEGSLKLHIVECNVSEMMRKIVADYLMFLDGQHYTVEVNIADDDVYAAIDPALIERAVRNLIDNALRYGADGEYLEVGLEQQEQYLRFTIIDKGRGIPVEDQKHVFDRFYRVDRSREAPGLGIGLSIVQDIISYHGGTISLTSVPFHTVFEIRLPIHQLNL